jgi:hypothetical protein
MIVQQLPLQQQEQQHDVAVTRCSAPTSCNGLSSSNSCSRSSSSSSSSSGGDSGCGSICTLVRPLLGPFGSVAPPEAAAAAASVQHTDAASTDVHTEHNANSSSACTSATTDSDGAAAAGTTAASTNADDDNDSIIDSGNAIVAAAAADNMAVDTSEHAVNNSTTAAAAVEDAMAVEPAEPAAANEAVHIDALSALYTLTVFRDSLAQVLQRTDSAEARLQQVQWLLDIAVQKVPLLALPVQHTTVVYAQLPAAAAADLQRLVQLHSFAQQTLSVTSTVAVAKLQRIGFVVHCKLNADQ